MGLDRYVSHHLVMSALLLLRRRRSTQREELWEVETRHLLIAARAAMFTFAVWASPGQAHASSLGLTSPGVPVVDAGYSRRYRNYYAADYRYRCEGGGWAETVLHSFNGTDGLSPYGLPIVDRVGNIYGTTYEGGSGLLCSGGCGVVWEITP